MENEELEEFALIFHPLTMYCPSCHQISVVVSKRRFRNNKTGKRFFKGHLVCCNCFHELKVDVNLTTVNEPEFFMLGGDNC